MLTPNTMHDIPDLTKEVAQAAFPKGNVVMTIRDELGALFADEAFQALYPRLGQPAVSPARLALVTLLQFMENLTDREAAEAVRGRIDWKYALGLTLDDAGFHYSVLSEFRQRLVAGGQEAQLLTAVLARCEEKGLLTGRKKQRTDSTHVLANIRVLNRIEIVGEALRRVLNDLAQRHPAWLQPRIQPAWGKRYSHKLETSRLSQRQRTDLVQALGEDGHFLLTALAEPTTPPELNALASVAQLRIIWRQQFYIEGERITWRRKREEGIPPAHKMVASPDEPEARYAARGSTHWTGYKVHLTETCGAAAPRLITDVTTTAAPVPDLVVTEQIQAALQARGLTPETHLCDGAYVSVDIMAGAAEQGIDLVGPVHQDSSWQGQAAEGYDLGSFAIDWVTMTATCPEGQTSTSWKRRTNAYGKPDLRFAFARPVCHPCPARPQCTRSEKYGRQLTVYPQQQHETLIAARQRQETDAFRALYQQRAGIEGTISQAVRKLGLRRARYRGLRKTHLQHVATAAAINLKRVAHWLRGGQPETTRTSAFAALAMPF